MLDSVGNLSQARFVRVNPYLIYSNAMKLNHLLLAALAFVILGLSSCITHIDCPAYSKKEEIKKEVRT